jgi:hypothetical protein
VVEKKLLGAVSLKIIRGNDPLKLKVHEKNED